MNIMNNLHDRLSSRVQAINQLFLIDETIHFIRLRNRTL